MSDVGGLSTPYTEKKLARIEILREEVLRFPLNNLLEAKLSRNAIFSSTYYGLMLSGIDIFRDDAERCILYSERPAIDPQKVLAMQNYKKVIAYIHEYYDMRNSPLSYQFISNINLTMLAGLKSPLEIGIYRRLEIPNTYAAEKIPEALQSLLIYVEKGSEHPLVRIGYFYLVFQRIMPFAWGNGRTARALSLLLLYTMGYSFAGFLAPEVWMAQQRCRRHHYLLKQAIAGKIPDAVFIEYFVYCISLSAAQVLRYLRDPSLVATESSLANLTTTQKKVLQYLEEHTIISMGEYLLSISSDKNEAVRDFERLRDLGLIEKKGFGQSTYYVLRKPS